jgi:hypothetical protein
MPAVTRHSLFLPVLCAAALLAVLVLWAQPGWLVKASGMGKQQWGIFRFFGIVACATVALVITLWSVLTYYLAPTEFSQKKDIIQLIAQILGGATLLITLFSTWQGVRENQAKLEESKKASDNAMEMARLTLAETRARQIAEQYSRATDQLGSSDRRTRIGAIYALGQIASNSDEFYWPIVQLLTSYVTENSPWKVGAARPADQFPSDVQAALNVLASRKKRWQAGEDAPLELRGTDLRGLILKNKDGAPETGAHFEGAKFDRAHFEGGTTNLRGVHFEHAVLWQANLGGAYLSGAYLEDAGLEDADVGGADFSLAHGLTRDQIMSAKNFECAKLDRKLQDEVEQTLGRAFKCPGKNK